MRKFIVGSRRSGLALTQSKQFIDSLKEYYPDIDIEIKEIVTKGDRIVDVQLSKVGGKGLFVKEIEQALENKEIDMAIHSLKDVPSSLSEGFTIACVPQREDMRDAFLSNDKVTFKNLPAGSVVGTSSLRRGAQLLAMRDDIEVKWVRGNIDTRIKKMESGEYDAIILAAAGLKRMGWSDDIGTEYLDPETFIPAIAQGALGIECRSDDRELIEMLQKVHSEEDAACTNAERAFLKRMDGSCQVPIGGHAKYEDGELYLTGLIMPEDVSEQYVVRKSHENPEPLGNLVADEMERIGAKDIIDRINESL